MRITWCSAGSEFFAADALTILEQVGCGGLRQAPPGSIKLALRPAKAPTDRDF